MATPSPGISFDEYQFLDDFHSPTDASNILALLHQFASVRYVAVASLTLVLFDRIHSARGSPWRSANLSLSSRAQDRLLHLLARYLSLFCLAVDVVIYTQHLSDCSWWFSFRTWFTVVLATVAQAIMIHKLPSSTRNHRDGRRPPWSKALSLTSTLILLPAQLVLNAILTARDLRRHSAVSFAPNPGPWFDGCFPILEPSSGGAFPLQHVWISAIAFTGFYSLSAVLLTWCHRPAHVTLWTLAQSNGLFYFLCMLAGTVFCGTWWMTAPMPLVCLAPTLATVVWSLFGCRLLLVDDEDDIYAKNGAAATACQKDLESTGKDGSVVEKVVVLPIVGQGEGLSSVSSPQNKSSFDLSPHSETPSLPAAPPPPPPIVDHNSLVQPPLPPSPTPPPPPPQHLAIQLARPLSETTLHNTIVEEGDIGLDSDFDEEQWDEEEGSNKLIKRTHERKWKSDEFPVTPTSQLPPAIPLATRPRSISDFTAGFFERTTAVEPMTITTVNHPGLTILPPQPPSSSKRRIVSSFFHRNHPPVPEEDTSDFSSFPASPISPLSSSAPEPKRKRVRRFLSGGKQPKGKKIGVGCARRRDSDAVTICTVSTTFAFDNAGARDAPDFTN